MSKNIDLANTSIMETMITSSIILFVGMGMWIWFGTSLSALISSSPQNFFDKIKKEANNKGKGIVEIIFWMAVLNYFLLSGISIMSVFSAVNSGATFQQIMLMILLVVAFGFSAYKKRFSKALNIFFGRKIIQGEEEE